MIRTAPLLLRNCRFERSRFLLDVPALAAHPGETLALVGPSGSGKSTLLEILALLRRPTHLRIHDMPTGGEADNTVSVPAIRRTVGSGALERLRAMAIGYAPQREEGVSVLSGYDNIALRAALAGRDASAVAERVGTLAEAFEIRHDELGRMPGALSVGQRQRLMLIRTLVHDPALILADEPTSALHPTLADRVLRHLLHHARETHAVLIVATHEVARAEALGFRMVRALTRFEDSNAVTQWRLQ